jgi:serine/threonine protein kinase
VKIADALADSHALGVLHRDVKPENILVTQFGEPVLADFGLAILAEVRDVSITFDVLTPAYAPPEFFWHARPGASGDVYSLCATLYTLMRGRPPRWSDDRNPSLVSIVDMFAEWVPDLPGVPQEFTSLLRSGMSNDPSARPSAIELRDALLGLRLATYISPVPRRRDLMLTNSGSVLGDADVEPTIENPTQPISESDLLLVDPRADPPAAAADPAPEPARTPDEPGRAEPGCAGVDGAGQESSGADGGFAPPRQRDVTTEAGRRRRWWTFVGSITGR